MTESIKAEYTLGQILKKGHEAFDKGYVQGRENGRDQVFDLIIDELDKVRNLSIFYDKPGLNTAIAVVRNTRDAAKKGLVAND